MVTKFTNQPTNKQIVNKINDVIDAIPTNLATVATSGSYNDLSNKPTIPTVNNATLTIQKNGTTVKTFTANASSNVTANITVPTKVSELTNDSGFTSNTGTVTSVNNVSPVNGNVSITIPTVPTNVSAFTNDSGYISSIPSSYLQNTATGTNALTIKGTATSATSAVNIGATSTAGGGYSTAVGYYAASNGARSTSIGYGARIGASTADAIQIGNGTNSTAKTLSVGFYNTANYTLLDGTTGLIPDDRLSSNIARTSAIPDISTKQDTLVSGTNIKTINGSSILGSGDLTVAGSGGANIDLSNLSTTGQAVIDGKVSKSGDTMTGGLYINPDTSVFLGTGNVPVGSFRDIEFSSVNSHMVGIIRASLSSDGNTCNIVFGASNPNNDAPQGFQVTRTNSSVSCSFPATKCCDGQWVIGVQTIIDDVSLTNSNNTNLTKTVTLPNDGYKYEVVFRGTVVTGNTSGNTISLYVTGNESTNTTYCCGTRTRTSSTMLARGQCSTIMSYGSNNLTIGRSSGFTGTATLEVIRYRRIGSNS